MKESKLPKTDSIEALAKFWDSHDVTDFEDQLEEVPGQVFERVPESEEVLRLEPNQIEAGTFLRVGGKDPACLSCSPDVMGGTPVFTGTRVPVQTFLDHLEAGESIDDFLAGFPSVTREQVIAYLLADATKTRCGVRSGRPDRGGSSTPLPNS